MPYRAPCLSSTQPRDGREPGQNIPPFQDKERWWIAGGRGKKRTLDRTIRKPVRRFCPPRNPHHRPDPTRTAPPPAPIPPPRPDGRTPGPYGHKHPGETRPPREAGLRGNGRPGRQAARERAFRGGWTTRGRPTRERAARRRTIEPPRAGRTARPAGLPATKEPAGDGPLESDHPGPGGPTGHRRRANPLRGQALGGERPGKGRPAGRGRTTRRQARPGRCRTAPARTTRERPARTTTEAAKTAAGADAARPAAAAGRPRTGRPVPARASRPPGC